MGPDRTTSNALAGTCLSGSSLNGVWPISTERSRSGASMWPRPSPIGLTQTDAPPPTLPDLLRSSVRWWARGLLAVEFSGGCTVAAHNELGDMHAPNCHKTSFEAGLIALAHEAARQHVAA